jgi:tetratricopeptide (TPR) repeat protein
VGLLEATRLIKEAQPTSLAPFKSELKGDPETIVFKSLEKNRDERYQSAADLAADIRRYLKNEPILARPHSLIYHYRAFARRHRALVGSIVAVFAALVIGIVVASIGLVQARQAEAKALEAQALAEKEATTANTITGYFQDMFSSLDARVSGGDVGADSKIADLLDGVAQDLESRFETEPEVRATLQWSIGNGYKALGIYTEAEPQLRAALATRQQVLPSPHPDIAQSMHDLGAAVWWRGRMERDRELLEESESLFSDMLEMRRELFGEEHEEVANSLNYLAASLDAQRRYAEAEELYRQSLSMRKRIWGVDHERVARSTNNLAYCLVNQQKYSEAEDLYLEAIQIMRECCGENHMDVATGLYNLARCLMLDGRLREAAPKFRESLPIKRRLQGEYHSSVGIAVHYFAECLAQLGEFEEAEQQARDAIEIWYRTPGTEVRKIRTLDLLARVLLRREKWADALQAAEELHELRQEREVPGHWRIAVARSLVGAALLGLQRYDEAEPLLRESYELLNDNPRVSPADVEAVLERLIILCDATDRTDRAATYREALARRQAGP